PPPRQQQQYPPSRNRGTLASLAHQESRLRPACHPHNLQFRTLTSVPLRIGVNHFSFFLTTAGTPATSESAGTSFVTTAPAPVIDPRPTFTGATSMVSLPSFTSSSISVSCFFAPS